MTEQEIEVMRELTAAINRLVEALPPRSGLGGGWPPISVSCSCNCRSRSPYGPGYPYYPGAAY